MSDARAERIDNAVASAGELIAALQDEGPVTPRQARVIVFAAVRAAVPNFEEWEVRGSAARMVPALKRKKGVQEEGVQLALPLEGDNENHTSDVR
jgi:hypothetical protein